MPNRKKALGRGLSALLPASERALRQVSIAEIAPNPHQPREALDEEGLSGLAESIRQHGVLQPLIVAEAPPAPDSSVRYRLIAGERRWRAAALAGLDMIPVVVREADPEELLALALVENLQREDLNPIEEARAYQELTEGFGLTQEEVAQRVGRSRSAVANSLRLLRLPSNIIQMVLHRDLTEGHARALLSLPSADLMQRLADEVRDGGLSVRQTEARAEQLRAGPPRGRRRAQQAVADPFTESLEQNLRSRLGTKVRLIRGKRGGRLVIHFYSDEELDGILQAIGGDPWGSRSAPR